MSRAKDHNELQPGAGSETRTMAGAQRSEHAPEAETSTREGFWSRTLLLLIVGSLLFFTLLGESLPSVLGAWMHGLSQVILRLVVILLLWRFLVLKAEMRRIQNKTAWATAPAAEAHPSRRTTAPPEGMARQTARSTAPTHRESPHPEPTADQTAESAAQTSQGFASEKNKLLSIPGPGSPAPSPTEGTSVPPSASFPEWMRGAYAQAIERLRSLEAQWTKECQAQAAASASSGPAEAQQVAEVAASFAALLREKGDDPVSVRNLEQMAARLQAFGAPGGDPAAAFRKQVPDPPSPEQWLQASGAEQDYFEQVSDRVQRAKELLASGPPTGAPDRGAGWRGSAEQLLLTIASRRPVTGEEDPDGMHRLHDRLLQVLGWKEIPVNRSDSVNRDLHEIESMRGTAELPPNRVLEIVSPGYRDDESGEIVRKARVILSQQKLG